MKVKPLRRVLQIAVLGVLIAVPYYTQNPIEWSPSRIALGELPPFKSTEVWGTTWSFTAWGVTLTHPLAALEVTLSSKTLYLPLLISVAIPLFITLAFGRVFCSWLCPMGFILEINQNIRARLRNVGIGWNLKIRDYRYQILGISLLFSFIFGLTIISAFDPPHVLGRELFYLFTYHRLSLTGVMLLGGIVTFDALASDRAWCRNFCPAGGFLSLLGAKRIVKIQKHQERCIFCGECNLVCPYQLRPVELGVDKDFNDKTCDNCGLCRDVCPAGALYYTIRR
jgi:ferredoxin-type protein NapH